MHTESKKVVFLTRKELATRWKMSVKALENWAITKDGAITHGPAFIRIRDRSVRYPLEAVVAYERDHLVKVRDANTQDD